MTPPDSTDDRAQRQLRRLGELRDDIQRDLAYIEDPDLKRRTIDWLQRFDQLPDGDILDYIEGQLAALRTGDRATLRPPADSAGEDADVDADVDETTSGGEQEADADGDADAPAERVRPADAIQGSGSSADGGVVGQFAMARQYDSATGSEEFPESCQGCPHYGTMCPVFRDTTELSYRRRLQDELVDASASKVKLEYRRFAQQNECHQIPEFIREWEAELSGVAAEGWALYREIEARVNTGSTDLETDAEQAVARAAKTEGGND